MISHNNVKAICMYLQGSSELSSFWRYGLFATVTRITCK